VPNIVVVGAQWGDEGKGKIVDLIAPCVDVVVRYQGGPNAGHTVVVGEERFVLQTLPSGVLRPGKRCVIGSGVVVDPAALLEEMDGLRAAGLDLDQLYLSQAAHVITPYHQALDRATDQARIGTTGKGVGPAYADKAARLGVRVADLLDPAVLREKLAATLPVKNHLLRGLYGHPGFEAEGLVRLLGGYAERLRPHVADTALLLHRWLRDGATVLFEGAQGTLLDVDHGTYPYVTASSATAGGAATGTGVPPTRIHGVLGVTKAYATRVGEGPFPTEVTGDLGELIRARGKEYGSVTGRPRRCGWFDAPLLRHAVRVNGLDTVAMTKLDVLDPCHRVRVGVGYRYRGSLLRELPLEARVLAEIEPVYEEREGWLGETAGLRAWEDLPGRARDYVSWVQDLVECEISLISTGPARDETILLPASRLLRWFPDVRQLCLSR
jgi:adenylosuccinate synthase